MLKSTFATALLLAASAASAQPAATPPQPASPTAQAEPQPVAPPPAFIEAATAFGQCIQGAVGQLAATVTPEAGATQAIAGCATQKAAMESQFEAWVASDGFPAEGRDIARTQFRSQMGQVESQVAGAIRTQRAAPAAPATPAPAQSGN